MAKPNIKDTTLIWHLGWQKTGTTIFQSLIRRNRELLEDHCAIFPKQHWTQRLQNAGLAYWADPSQTTEKALKAKARAIREKTREAGHTYGIVSDENIIGLELYDDRGGMIDMAAAIMPVIERAVAPAKSVFVFYTRDWDRWFRSAHNQVVKQLRCRAGFDDWVASAPFAQDWDAHRARLQDQVSGPVIFRDLGQDAAEGKPMGGAILELAGVPPEVFPKLAQPVGKNESLPPGALAFMLEINRSHIQDHGMEIVRTKVLKHIDAFK
ncbi:MAG: hypothetical protein AAF631_02865 [Pseudomonadota bacterium]